MERISYSPAEAAEVLGVSRSSIYEMMLAGRLPSRKWGRRRLIMRADLVALLDALGGEYVV